jgi:DNA-directed RNA polymerase specialized sigma24 family protein
LTAGEKAQSAGPVARGGQRQTIIDMAAAIIAASAVRAHEDDIAATRAKTAERKREKRGAPIDFHLVPAHQVEIDGRLRNWGIWCNSRAAASSSPMFRLVPPTLNTRRENHARGGNTLDRSDAIRIAQAVTALPEKHAAGLNWCYVKPVSPRKACEAIGCTMEGLQALVIEGRQMLINRGE